MAPVCPSGLAASSCPRSKGLLLQTLPLPVRLTSAHHLLSCHTAGSRSLQWDGKSSCWPDPTSAAAFSVSAAVSGPRGQAQERGGSLSLCLHLRRTLSSRGSDGRAGTCHEVASHPLVTCPRGCDQTSARASIHGVTV